MDDIDGLRQIIDALSVIVNPALPVIGAVLIAYISRGVAQKASASESEEKEEIRPVTASRFNAGLLHHIASQERRIAELETQLENADYEKRELRLVNTQLKLRIEQLEGRIDDLEKRL